MPESEIRLPDVDFAAEPLPDLHEVLAGLRALEPVSRIVFAGKPIWLFNDAETVRRFIGTDGALSAPDAYDELFLPTMGKGLPVMRGREHQRKRALISRVFFPGRMREYAETLFAREAEQLSATLHGRVDLVPAFTRKYTFQNIARLLGVPLEDVTKLRGWADRMMRVYLDVDSASAAAVEIGDYLTPIVEERRRLPKDDVISLLTQAELDGERLSTDDILGFCRNLFPAAIDTSTNSLGSLLAHVLRDRALWRELATSHDLREAAITELLRWEPPLVMIPRRATEDLELGGHRICAGDDVRLCLTGAHDDPAAYEEPRTFRLDRTEPNLAFGHGEHYCLGTQMAKRVLEKAVEVLANDHPDMALCADAPPRIVGGVLRGPTEVMVTV